MKKILFFLILLPLASCRYCFVEPEAFRLRILDAKNQSLLGTVYQQPDIKLYYKRGSDTVKVNFTLFRASDQSLYLASQDIATMTMGNYMRYILQLGPNDINTLNINSTWVKRKGCNYVVYKDVIINNKQADKDHSCAPWAYILRK